MTYIITRQIRSPIHSVSFSHEGYFFLLFWGVFSLTELTDLTEHICALFRTHKTPPAYRYHRTL